eukprot:TRINITY_DN38155_c0_g1_i1.p1 TRINITY_DN38155_c0_g1~~TRINITY_DN38155_c0_g1_i1.p1  ORF type:complete len:628 (-),score=89.54 TRINITY_DN38155_c0_g1_i1:37-1920(-)
MGCAAELPPAQERTRTVMVLSTRFEVPERYSELEAVCQSAYTCVCAAYDALATVPGERVALKKIEGPFENESFAKRTLRELRILRQLQHENIVGLRRIFLPAGSPAHFNDVYVVTGLMEADLGRIIRSSQPLTEEHSRFFVYQILRGLKYVHSARVIHRDLKPRNLLVNSDCDLRICDFGLALVEKSENEEGELHRMTDYVGTRWYRAPELLCNFPRYSRPVDLWSIGCIFAELLSRRPIFPGVHTEGILHHIGHLLGPPSEAFIQAAPLEKCRSFLRAIAPQKAGLRLEDLLPKTVPAGLDLLGNLLQIDPAGRLDAQAALSHDYFGALRCPEDEPEMQPLGAAGFEFEKYTGNIQNLREEMWNEAQAYLHHPRRWPWTHPTSNGGLAIVANTPGVSANANVALQSNGVSQAMAVSHGGDASVGFPNVATTSADAVGGGVVVGGDSDDSSGMHVVGSSASSSLVGATASEFTSGDGDSARATSGRSGDPFPEASTEAVGCCLLVAQDADGVTSSITSENVVEARGSSSPGNNTRRLRGNGWCGGCASVECSSHAHPCFPLRYRDLVKTMKCVAAAIPRLRWRPESQSGSALPSLFPTSLKADVTTTWPRKVLTISPVQHTVSATPE